MKLHDKYLPFCHFDLKCICMLVCAPFSVNITQLTPNTNYRFKISACTHGGCTESVNGTDVLTPVEGNHIGFLQSLSEHFPSSLSLVCVCVCLSVCQTCNHR